MCPLCQQRKARRACPALNRQICSVCCGTKRLVEIRCPSTCVYLASSRAHPPAAAMRQHEHDVRLLGPALQGLSERQVAIFLLLTSVTRRYRSTTIPPLRDADLIDATAAMASTIETADRGIIYEHRTTSIPAQRLVDEYQRALTELGKDRPAALQRDVAAALRGLERAGRAMPQGSTETALLDLLERVTRNDPPIPETAATSDVSVTGEGAASPDAPRIVLG